MASPNGKLDAEHFRSWLPEHTSEEIQQLRRNLESDGRCIQSLIKWKGTNKLIEGIHRYDLSTELGIAYNVIEMPFDAEADVIEWMLNHQSGRRNWTDSQRAFALEKLRRFKAEHSNGESVTSRNTLRSHAKENDVSLPDAHAATVVLDKGSDKLHDAVSSGEISIRKAAQIAERVPKRQQSVAIREGIESIAKDDEELRDDLGNEVPKELREAFKAREQFDSLLNDLRSIMTTINPLAGSSQENREPLPGFEHFASERQEFSRAIEQARTFLKFNRPYAVCPEKHGKGKCSLCGNAGYVTTRQSKQLKAKEAK